MFTRQAYNKAGGYGSRRTFEDGELVVRMLVNGVIFHNIPEVLVHFRGGEDMIIRRKRVPFKHALSLLTLQYRLGYTSVFHVCLLSLIRLIVHISPRKVTWLIYRFALRKKIDNHSQRVN